MVWQQKLICKFTLQWSYLSLPKDLNYQIINNKNAKQKRSTWIINQIEIIFYLKSLFKLFCLLLRLQYKIRLFHRFKIFNKLKLAYCFSEVFNLFFMMQTVWEPTSVHKAFLTRGMIFFIYYGNICKICTIYKENNFFSHMLCLRKTTTGKDMSSPVPHKCTIKKHWSIILLRGYKRTEFFRRVPKFV